MSPLEIEYVQYREKKRLLYIQEYAIRYSLETFEMDKICRQYRGNEEINGILLQMKREAKEDT